MNSLICASYMSRSKEWCSLPKVIHDVLEVPFNTILSMSKLITVVLRNGQAV